MRPIATSFLLLFLLSCGSSNQEASSNENTEILTEQQELSIADSLSQEIKESTQTLKEEAVEAKESIDELLEDI